MTAPIRLERPAEHIARIVIDNPPRNALGLSVREILLAELEALANDNSIRCLIITGTGTTFCSGDDLREAAARDGEAPDNLKQFGRVLAQMEAFPKPVIAAINGHAVGGGLELALCCDIRIAATQARFVAAGVNIGLMASTFRLPRAIGIARAKRMLLTGSPIDADIALQWGLVTDLHPGDTLEAEALTLAQRIASRAPLSVEAAKRHASRALDDTPAEAMAAARADLDALSKSSDHREGLRAFVEKREPKFTRS